PATVYLLAKATAPTSNDVHLAQQPKRQHAAPSTARTEALRFRMVQVTMEIRFVCFRHSALTVSCRVECVRKTVLILVVWVIDVDRHQVHPVALILLKLRSQGETGWIDVGWVAHIRENGYEKDAVGAESIPSMQPFQ